MKNLTWWLPLAAAALFVACSDSTTNITNNFAPDGGGNRDARGDGDVERDADVPTEDAEPPFDAAADQDAAPACPSLPPPAATSDDCFVKAECPTCVKGWQYECADGGRPNIEKCATKDGALCCPAACVRYARQDSACAFGRRAWACPATVNGDPVMMPAGAGCGFTGSLERTARFCCEP